MFAPLRLLKLRQERRRLAREVRLNGQAAAAPLVGPVPERLAFHPTKQSIGSFSAGRALMQGEVTLAGQRYGFREGGFWDIGYPNRFAYSAAHGFGWLEDLSVLGTAAARRMAAGLVGEWLARHGQGTGRPWQPGLSGRRAMALIFEQDVLFEGVEDDMRARLIALLVRHRGYLAARAHAAADDLAEMAALCGLVMCQLALGAPKAEVEGAVARLCRAAVLARGNEGVASRAPQDALTVFADLVAVLLALGEAGHSADSRLNESIETLAPGLRYLRLGDGALPRFHGGGAGQGGQLDRVLSDSGVRSTIHPSSWMGFARVTGGRVVAIMDCAAPAGTGPAAALAHASTFGFELTSGRRPLIVNCGPGRGAAPGWAEQARQTAAHSTLAIETASSSVFGVPERHRQLSEAVIAEPPTQVTLDRGSDSSGQWLTATHDGYVARFGMVHERRFFIDALGREVRGEDLLRPPSAAAGRRERRRLRAVARLGAPAAVRFYLHPDVSIVPHSSAERLGLRLKSGEYWEFDCSGGDAAVEDGRYVSPDHPQPVATRQIVLRARTKDQQARFLWRFTRGESGRRSLRDLQRDDMADAE